MTKVLFIFLLTFNVMADILEVSCLGPEKADKYIIYLHGMDGVIPSPQEKNNRAILANLAKDLKLRIALPRAPKKCPSNKDSICWGGI